VLSPAGFFTFSSQKLNAQIVAERSPAPDSLDHQVFVALTFFRFDTGITGNA
jgi:hypothetical protein